MPSESRVRLLVWLLAPGIAGAALCAFLYALWELEPSRLTAIAVVVIVANAYAVAGLCRFVLRRFGAQAGAPHEAGRLLRQLVLSATVAVGYVLAVYVPLKLWLIGQGEQDAIGPAHLLVIGVPALVIALLTGLTHFALAFRHGWVRSAHESDLHRQQAMRARLDALQAQVNPHFLFNSLNTVHGLVEEAPAQAQAMLLRLADVFRYASRHGADPAVTLHDELAFLDAYVDLLQARHGHALSVDIQRQGDERERWLPPLALQTLVENAVKHTAFDAEHPLVVNVTREHEVVVVSNPMRQRSIVPAPSGTGLESLRRRYELLGAPPVAVEQDGACFAVRLPLLRRPQ